MCALAVDEDTAWRATLGTSRHENHGGEIRLVPDFTRSMASDLLFRELHPEVPVEADFYPFLRRGTAAWDDFFAQRKVVHRELLDGTVLASVTSNVVDVADAGVVRKVPGFGETLHKVRKFEVIALLSDHDLIRKFEINGGFRAEVRNLAAVDTGRAALRLQSHVRQYAGYEYAEVVPGRYATSWKAARESLKTQAARFTRTSVAVDALFVGDKIFMYGDEGREGWRVFGPESVASLVRHVHTIVQATSCESVIFALGPELTILDIDIHDGRDVLCPSRERHAGSHDDLPLMLSSQVGSILSTAGMRKLLSAADACEVLAIDGMDCATAVRVSSKYVLVNSHVVNEGGELTSQGRLVVPHRLLSRDLWLARCEGPAVAWHLRDAEVGEEAVLCYRRHEKIQFGGPVRILTAGTDVMALSRDAAMQPGVSGAAVVSIRDFALLAVYDGVAVQRGLAAAYTSEMYTDMCTMSETDAESRASARDTGSGVYAKMKARGYGKVVSAAMDALVPMYSGAQHVGTGFRAYGNVYTACDPAVAPLGIGEGGQPLVFEVGGRGLFKASDASCEVATPAVNRSPAYGEKVFVLGKDKDGAYSSAKLGRVTHVGLNAHVFQVSGLETGELPFVGGLVMAYADAAVVGVFASSSIDRRQGLVAHCCAYPEGVPVAPAAERAEASIQRLFPFLRPSTWDAGVAETVLSHSSAVGGALESRQAAYAMVGDSAMRTELWVHLLRADVPSSQWQGVVQRVQSNAAQSQRCATLGLAKVLRVGGGLVVNEGSKVLADMLEAVAGAVYLYESAERFATFCTVVGAVPEGLGLNSQEKNVEDQFSALVI